jgi:MoaA/NifB/PqqE/SkfB family radical SAM enzyme
MSVSKTFCVLPFIHQFKLMTDEWQLCCYSSTHPNAKVSTSDDSVEAFNSPTLNTIRQQMISGDIPDQCTGCFESEQKGLTSARQQLLENTVQFDVQGSVDQFISGNKVTPQWYDIRLSNTCSLKCRTCNSYNSSAIRQEYSRINLPLVLPISPINHRIESPQFHVHGIKRVYLAGGEPFLEKQNLDLLSKLQDVNPDIEVIINTSGSVVPDGWLDQLKKFKRLHITLSIDGHKEVNEYIRSNTNTEVLNKNIHDLSSVSEEMYVNSVLSLYNVLSVHRLYETLNPLPVKDIILSHVNEHTFMQIQHLPYNLRDKAIQSLTQAKEIVKSNRSLPPTFDEMIHLLKTSNYNEEEFLKFIRYSRLLDSHREGPTLADVIPEYTPYYEL